MLINLPTDDLLEGVITYLKCLIIHEESVSAIDSNGVDYIVWIIYTKLDNIGWHVNNLLYDIFLAGSSQIFEAFDFFVMLYSS